MRPTQQRLTEIRAYAVSGARPGEAAILSDLLAEITALEIERGEARSCVQRLARATDSREMAHVREKAILLAHQWGDYIRCAGIGRVSS